MSYKAFVIKLMELVEHLEKAQNLSEKLERDQEVGGQLLG